jgi:SAM-dependent methyltransferase
MALHPLAEIARKPEGGLGVAMADYMDWLNAKVQDRAVSMLSSYRARHLIEIGFGGGALAHKLYDAGQLDRYLGVEISETLVREFNKAHHVGGRRNKHLDYLFEAIHASVELMPLRAEQFDCAVAMNTIYWWNNPVAGLREIHRVLKPSGTLLIGMVLKSDKPPVGYGQEGGPVHYDEDELADMVREAHFLPQELEIFSEHLPVQDGDWSRSYVIATAEAI